MEIQPATLEQVTLGRDGHFVQIDDDVASISARLRELDPRLRLRYSEPGEYFVVYRVIERPDGSTKKDIVTTSNECDGRLLARVERVYSRSYNYGEELDRVDRAAQRQQERERNEEMGALAERLAHAMRKDLGLRPAKVYVPREV